MNRFSLVAAIVSIALSIHAQDASSTAKSDRNHPVGNAVDHDWRTFWQTSAQQPHELTVDLKKSQVVYGFVYIPVPFSRKGRILDYEVLLSDQPNRWGKPVYKAAFQKSGGGFWPDKNERMARVFFPKPVTGRYVKLRAVSRVDNSASTAVAEFQPITDKDDVPYKDTTLAMLKGSRYAPSVHLSYGMPKATEYYIEATVTHSAPGSYFMAMGFSGGYFGIQEQANGRKVVLFSVWDKHKGNNPNAVPEALRVKNPFTGKGVLVKRFGGEGTGGQSFFVYNWKLGQTYRFLVKAVPAGDWTMYTGFFYLPEAKTWKKLVTFSTYTKSGRLNGAHSFVEDFRRNFDSFSHVRCCQFTNGWARKADGAWVPIAQARFTRDGNPNVNVDAGPVVHGFFLKTGGNTINKTTKLWSTAKSTPAAAPPADLP